ncbi:hypothetical protein FJO69_00395 [[Mycoplasma] falconis]|uniref:Smr domain-containing protein n=1 Tax=[Mycoplasma] falconis TaxID=92403 RepID=A0A501XCM4_9BACT|nr:hypothetical protein [[Mycoplasma] falconis]TPE58107.1 hypothetical protein FJO69_00395 [[Mycoplasma] falconis]
MNFKFFPMEIDLHGMDTNQATAYLLGALFEFNEDRFNQYMDIIVGVGSGAMKFVTEQLLEEEGYPYKYLTSNGSKIRVYHR